MWMGSPEYRGTSAHHYARGFSGFEERPGQPGFLGALGTVCSSALGQINPWIPSGAAY